MKIKEELQRAINDIVDSDVPIVLERPEVGGRGDFACSIALKLAKTRGKHPKEYAREIVDALEKKKIDGVAHIEIADPGFINFFLKSEVFFEEIKNINEQKDTYGKNKDLAGKKVVIEYTDPNPFKEFHIGHLMSNAIGESLSRIIEFQGAEVKRANYQGDVGLHVAKAIWAVLHVDKMVKNMYPDAKEENIVHDWEMLSNGKAYATGNKYYETDEEAKKQIVEINKKIYEKSDQDINRRYEEGKDTSLRYFEKIYKRLGTNFDFLFFESDGGPRGKDR